MKIVCVHWGSKYKVEYVNTLNNMIKRHSDAELICLSDSFEGKDCEVMMLEKGFTGWWNKIQLFRKDFLKGERFLYLDLDIVITENISNILNRPEKFVTIKDWIYNTYNSSAMLMTGGEHAHVYDLFVKDPEKAMKACPEGDQQFITSYVEGEIFSNKDFASFRMSGSEGAPKAAVTVFHGRPNPHEVKGTWVEKHWR